MCTTHAQQLASRTRRLVSPVVTRSYSKHAGGIYCCYYRTIPPSMAAAMRAPLQSFLPPPPLPPATSLLTACPANIARTPCLFPRPVARAAAARIGRVECGGANRGFSVGWGRQGNGPALFLAAPGKEKGGGETISCTKGKQDAAMIYIHISYESVFWFLGAVGFIITKSTPSTYY